MVYFSIVAGAADGEGEDAAGGAAGGGGHCLGSGGGGAAGEGGEGGVEVLVEYDVRHVVVVQAGTLEVLIGEVEAKGAGEVEFAAGDGGGADGIASVGRNAGAGEEDANVGAGHVFIVPCGVCGGVVGVMTAENVTTRCFLPAGTWNTKNRDCS